MIENEHKHISIVDLAKAEAAASNKAYRLAIADVLEIVEAEKYETEAPPGFDDHSVCNHGPLKTKISALIPKNGQ